MVFYFIANRYSARDQNLGVKNKWVRFSEVNLLRSFSQYIAGLWNRWKMPSTTNCRGSQAPRNVLYANVLACRYIQQEYLNKKTSGK